MVSTLKTLVRNKWNNEKKWNNEYKALNTMSDTQKVLSEYLTMFLNHGTSLAFQWLRL